MNTVGWVVRCMRAYCSSWRNSGLKITPSPKTRWKPSSTVRSASGPAEVECSTTVWPRRWASSMKCWERSEK